MTEDRPLLEEIPRAVTDELGALARGLLTVDHPLDRLAVVRLVRERLDEVLRTVTTLAIREARDDRHTFDTIGRALGVSGQRAHQLSRLEEPAP